MCGIFGVVGKQNDVAEVVFSGLKTLEYRGYDSWGVAIENNSRVKIDKHIGKIGNATVHLPKSVIGLGHTRWATHGGVTNINTHPHLDCSGRLAVVHNGIIENYTTIKALLVDKKHRFISETDTEVFAHLVEEEGKTVSIQTAVFKAFNQLEGSNAVVVLDATNHLLIACRNGSPLVVGVGDNEYFLASDVTPFLKKTKQVIYLDNGEGVILSQTGVKLFDLKNLKAKKPHLQTVDWQLEDAEKGGYSHFLLKEIMEQKQTILKAARSNQNALKTLAVKIASGREVSLIGCGTAYYCALMAKYFFSTQDIDANVFGAYEYQPFAHFFGKDTITIAISQSGETADTIIAANKAKQLGSYLVVIINARGSTLERMADMVIPVGAGPEIAVVSTKAFTAQLITLYIISSLVKNDDDRCLNNIMKLDNALNEWFNTSQERRVINLVKKIIEHNDMYLIGKHENFPAALEVALKIKETSYIHSEAFASGELKHGVITLIQKGTPCFVLASNDRIKPEILSSAAELRARGGYIIGIAPFTASEFDYHIKTPDIGELTVIFNIIVGQLLGYYLGIGRGTDPDKPRNLAKSVTVK